MDDIVYLIHPKNLSTYMDETLDGTVKLKFVVLDDTVARFALPTEEQDALKHFSYFKECFLSVVSRGVQTPKDFFSSDEHRPQAGLSNIVPCEGVPFENICQASHGSKGLLSENDGQASQGKNSRDSSSSIGLIDLGGFLTQCEAALPTLNGWLLGYPVIYLFKKENISEAVRSLSVSSLHRYELLIQSELLTFLTPQGQHQKVGPTMHELTSFTLPSELSSRGVDEEWISSFLSSMQNKAKDSQLWKSLELRVTLQICQSVVL